MEAGSGIANSIPTFYEFFAGGGMARAGLGSGWNCLFANDFDNKKCQSYELNWGDGVISNKDVNHLTTKELPGTPDLVWASFPCQDLSLAGMGAGLKGNRSGTFWPFWNLVKTLRTENRSPNLIVLENVVGALTSHGGNDFKAICECLYNENYRYGAIVVDAAEFLPHSRPRLFVIGISREMQIKGDLVTSGPNFRHSAALQKAYSQLTEQTKSDWIWWNLPVANSRTLHLEDIIEENPQGVEWHTPSETKKLLDMMTQKNINKVIRIQETAAERVGTIYKRTRRDPSGIKVQRAEVRFDDLAGCLRTPSGGSSRQLILVVNGSMIQSRLLSTREAARLMGLDDSYKLPSNYNEAYHLVGDGVAVPVVNHISNYILKPLLRSKSKSKTYAA